MRKRLRSVVLAAAAIAVIPVIALAKISGGDVMYIPKSAGRVTFKHEYHVNLKGQKCSNCHYKPFQMAAGSYQMDIKTLTKGDFCGMCHNGAKAFDLKSAGSCKKCHKGLRNPQ